MSEGLLAATGIVIGKNPTAGGYERLELLTSGAGYLGLMRRTGSSKKGAPVTQPDLFDFCEVRAHARSGGAWFLSEYILTRRFGGLAARYEALVAASEWCRLVAANAPAVESTSFLFDVTLRALDAWEKGAEPSAVRLKALYLFARDEGLPAKEDWFPSLPTERRNLAAEVIGSPLESLDTENVDRSGIADLVDRLEKWMCGEHHIVAPRPKK